MGDEKIKGAQKEVCVTLSSAITGAAFYRASGNSKFPTKVSVVSNVINIVGNTLFIYGLKWGVAGAALATLLSRVFSTVVIFYCLRKGGQTIE